MPIPSVLSIAGSDSSGGAGIQADIKTITAHKLYAQTAITALTAQNTLGVQSVLEIAPEFVQAQIDSVFNDIVPDAVKIGMLGSAEIAHAVATSLSAHHAKNIVLDPVMVATSGDALMKDDAVDVLVRELLGVATIVTPNIPEAEVLAQQGISNEDDMFNAAIAIQKVSGHALWVLVKGGHSSDAANDLLLTEHGRAVWLRGRKIQTENTHGTGCTLSSAIACGLASGFEVQASVSKAKTYVTGALEYDLGMGRGHGPLNHMWDW